MYMDNTPMFVSSSLTQIQDAYIVQPWISSPNGLQIACFASVHVTNHMMHMNLDLQNIALMRLFYVDPSDCFWGQNFDMENVKENQSIIARNFILNHYDNFATKLIITTSVSK
ncbi:hypothetical protein ACJX0J_018098 [Zea mays]